MPILAEDEVVLILVCVEVSVGVELKEGELFLIKRVLILVCVEVSVGDNYINIVDIIKSCLNPCLCGS